MFKVIGLISGILLLAGCSLSPINSAPVKEYAFINMKPRITAQRAKTTKSLLVLAPVASPGYNSSNMVYVMIPYDLQTYAYNRWVAPPAQMLLPILAQRIRNRHYFKAVVTAPFSGQSNYVLDTRLLILQQEFLRPTSQVRLLMQATLVNNTNNRVVASRRFQVVVDAPGNNPYSCVLAANQAVNVISKQIARFVIRSL